MCFVVFQSNHYEILLYCKVIISEVVIIFCVQSNVSSFAEVYPICFLIGQQCFQNFKDFQEWIVRYGGAAILYIKVVQDISEYTYSKAIKG